MEHPLLVQNEEKRLHIAMPLLFCFAMVQVWQMGIVYYFGRTLSFYGRTPLPVTPGNLALHIVASYLFSAAFIYFFPRFVVLSGRIVMGMALASALALYLPLPEKTFLTVAFFHWYCAVFMIGIEVALIAYLFKEETAARYLTIAYSPALFVIALLHNELLSIPFSVFAFFMVFASALLLFFFCRMPAGVCPRFAAKEDGETCPRRFFVMVFALGLIGNLMYMFGNTIAETIPHGLSVYYCANAAGAALVFVIWKRFGIPILRIGYLCVGLTVLGCFLALLSLFIPVLALPACALMSVGGLVCWLIPLFSLIQVKIYPARFITPVVIGLGLCALLIHSSLLEVLRDNMQFLYIVYVVIVVGLSVLYIVLEPYLTFSLRDSKEIRNDLSPSSQSLYVSLSAAFNQLTGQELRVAELILNGYSYTEIAQKLKIKPGTVKTHQRNIYSKLQINSKRELFSLAEKAQGKR